MLSSYFHYEFLIVFQFFVSVFLFLKKFVYILKHNILIFQEILLSIFGGNAPAPQLLGARAPAAPRVYAYDRQLIVMLSN